MSNTIVKTDFNFKNQISVYKGKVRDVYKLKNNLLVMVASDRLSAFDVVMPKGIPFKGQICLVMLQENIVKVIDFYVELRCQME